jgi:hypothetical protein
MKERSPKLKPQKGEPLPEFDQLLGYLNLSSGNYDSLVFITLNELFANLASSERDIEVPLHVGAGKKLLERLAALDGNGSTYRDTQQARAVIQLCFFDFPAAYRAFHSDVLFHQTDEFLFNAFFMGRVLESALRHSLHQEPTQVALESLIDHLNDYVGHRPVAILENHRCEPYTHEWIRPVPIFISGVGGAFGPYEELVNQAISILTASDPNLLRVAQFDLDCLDEIAIDPRALDFDHPVNRRPNHHFGQWDEHSVDGKGFYRRFIVHSITLDAMLQRVKENTDIPHSELMLEAGAVLACTMLMGAGISGSGPEAYDSEVTLGKLVGIIANYRDVFYSGLLKQLPPKHRSRLLAEAAERHQPFGAARQDINTKLSTQRDQQLIHCHLAHVYAGLGYRDAALAEASVVPVAAARLNSQIDCLMGSARGHLMHGNLRAAVDELPQVFALMRRGIDCGAIVDPWNIIGFDGNFSLFPATENSIRDHRIDDLVELVNETLSLYSELWANAAAVNELSLCEQIRQQFSEFVEWWHQFAAHEVMSVDAVDPQDVFAAAQHVAEALNLWHQQGAPAGNLEFWAQHARMFDSPSAFRLAIEALMDRQDFRTSSALLVLWLSQNEKIDLQQGDVSFYDLLWRWVSAQGAKIRSADPSDSAAVWNAVRKFHDYLEANAEGYWRVPKFSVGWSRDAGQERRKGTPDDSDSADQDNILRAAYENFTYEDETDDGFEGTVFENGNQSESELEAEAERIVERLEFIASLSDYWRMVAMFPLQLNDQPLAPRGKYIDPLDNRRETLGEWLSQAQKFRHDLSVLLGTVHDFALPTSGVDAESMFSYDRMRLYKESLAQQIINCSVQVETAIRMLASVNLAIDVLTENRSLDNVDSSFQEARPIVAVLAAMVLRDREAIIEMFPRLSDYLQRCRLLYVPLSRGGSPQEIVQFRTDQTSIRVLLETLPLLGLLNEPYELTKMAMNMERNMPIEQGAVTEFDELFRVAFSSMVKSLVIASQQRSARRSEQKISKKKLREVQESEQEALFNCSQDLTESMLMIWLEHSRTLRLSVLERVARTHQWQALLKFIKSYGADLFTQEFLQLSNIRAILHQGVDEWLYKMQRSDFPGRPRLFDEIGHGLSLRQAVEYLTLILEAVIENYPRYRDYNATTTQSDHGDMLHVLLDFLRLERRYDRILWHLKPVTWAHEILVREGAGEVARDWRRSLTERVQTEANRYLTMYHRLRKKYSVQMASIGQHLEGRFVKPMLIDRLVALVPQASIYSGNPRCQEAFEMLKFECDAMAAMSPGVGMDVPDWLEAVEDEVTMLSMPPRLLEAAGMLGPIREPIEMDWDDLVQQIEDLPHRGFDWQDPNADNLDETS